MEILKVEQIRKEYPGVVAVDGISFVLEKGESLALLGENGAGKSTTIKIISGVERPNSGRIVLENKEYNFTNPHEAELAGIGVVFQELSLVGELSIAENIFMNRQPRGRLGMIDFKRLYKDTSEILKIFGLELRPQLKVSKLSAGNKQIIEILKAISLNPKILILDEPTSSLSDVEIDALFKVIDKLKKEGMSFIYISHKLNEVYRLCEKVVIMRDGKFVCAEVTRNLTEEKMVALMVGREIKDLFGSNDQIKKTNTEVFRIKEFKRNKFFNNINFHINSGEIVGLFGLIGAGRTELAESIVGFTPKDTGNVFLNSTEINMMNPKIAINNGIGYVTEDRKELGLYLNKSIKENLVVNQLNKFSKNGVLDEIKMNEYAKDMVEKYGVSAYSIHQEVGKLSGGNQQKILLAMWLELNPSVMIFDEPTRGVDIGAKSEIYNAIRVFASKGNGTLIISSELPELIGLCDRIIVMKSGEITGEINKHEFSEEGIIGYATGIY